MRLGPNELNIALLMIDQIEAFYRTSKYDTETFTQSLFTQWIQQVMSDMHAVTQLVPGEHISMILFLFI